VKAFPGSAGLQARKVIAEAGLEARASKWVLALLLAPVVATAVTIPEVRIVPDPEVGFLLSWEGVQGHTYFVELSLDLQSWETLPFFEQGFDDAIVRGVAVSEPTVFFRVWATDVQTSDVLGTDFNGSGLTAGQELALGLNPVDKDPDRDGLTFADEALLGTNGYEQAMRSASVLLRVLSPN
jgi:hypothetical protein